MTMQTAQEFGFKEAVSSTSSHVVSDKRWTKHHTGINIFHNALTTTDISVYLDLCRKNCPRVGI